MRKITPAQYGKTLLRLSNAPDLNAVLDSFFNVLEKNGHLSKLPEILKEFEKAALEEKEGAEATLTAAAKENRETIAESVKRINLAGIGKFRVKTEVDENILSGFVLRVKDILIDASVKKQITNLKKSFI